MLVQINFLENGKALSRKLQKIFSTVSISTISAEIALTGLEY